MTRPGRYGCEACAAEYPVVLGIPDFRVFPDPYLAREADWEKGRLLAERAATCDFRGLLEHYWALTPETPPELAQRYVRHDLVGVARGRQALHAAEQAAPDRVIGPGCDVVELGCRAGGLLVAAARCGARVVGIDVAFRWLIVARKRLEEERLAARLVCACAQFLPFREGVADVVVAGHVLEHTHDVPGLLREAHRALRAGGTFVASTCNRFSLAGEPHVRLLGVGFLPRRFMPAYVRRRRGVVYQHVRLVSPFELRRLARRSPFGGGRIRPPGLDPGELEGLGSRERRLARAYLALRNWRVSRALLCVLGPLLELVCVKARGAAA